MPGVCDSVLPGVCVALSSGVGFGWVWRRQALLVEAPRRPFLARG